VPQLADGTELLGEYRDSGFREAPYLVRLSSGQIVQLTRLLYLVAAAADGTRDLAAIAEHVSDEFGRRLTADHVAYLFERKLRPLGVLAGPSENAPAPVARAPLALTVRAAVVPAEIVRPLAALFRVAFRPTFVGAALALLVVFDVWLFGNHGLGAAVREILVHPALLLLVFALVIASAAFHELGHAAACRYGGALPGAIGAGLYYVWPAFYTNVTDAYRLDRRGRLRTDLGGIYFNILFILVTAALYFRTGFEPLLVFVAVQHLQILGQFMPWVRLDGYYVLTDLTGVPDILSRIKPVLLSLVPDRPVERRVAELKPWVRIVLSVYVLTLVPVLALMIGLMAWHAPHFFVVAAHALRMQVEHASAAFQRNDLLALALAAVQALALLLPVAGLMVTLGRIALALRRASWRRLVRRRRLRIALVLACLAGLAALGFAAARPPQRAASTFIADVPRRGDPTIPIPRDSVVSQRAWLRVTATPSTAGRNRRLAPRVRSARTTSVQSTTVQSTTVVSPGWQPSAETQTEPPTSTTTSPTTTTTSTTTTTAEP
jgi:putative peptide zinc metalloprotease protein